MSLNLAEQIESSVKRLFPSLRLEQALVELLLERAQRNLIKYQASARRLEAKYHQDFLTFRKQILQSEPGFELEQDYFEWEMAVTGITDMTEEIERLRRPISES